MWWWGIDWGLTFTSLFISLSQPAVTQCQLVSCSCPISEGSARSKSTVMHITRIFYHPGVLWMFRLCDLDLSGCNVNDIALTIVGSNLPKYVWWHIRKLNLSTWFFSCDWVICSLRRLHLYGNSTVTGNALKSLVSKCTNITDLNLGQCCKVKQLHCHGRPWILMHANSKVCDVLQVNNDFVKIVANSLPQLRWLELRGCTQVSQTERMQLFISSLSADFWL